MRPADCLRHLEELTLLRRKYPDAWYNYGILLAEGGRLEEALQAVEKALEIHPQSVAALFTHVFLLADPATRAPRRSSAAVASSRDMLSNVPVMTNVFPVNGPGWSAGSGAWLCMLTPAPANPSTSA